MLSATPRTNATSKSPHYVVPDTNVILKAADLFEYVGEKPAFTDIILCQTVMEEVRHRSLPIYNRIRALVQNNDPKRFYVFHNEFQADTYVCTVEGESPNDRNDRAIRQTAIWYKRHLEASGSDIGIVLLTDDAENRRKAVEEGIDAVSVKRYVEGVGNDALLDMIVVEETEAPKVKHIYEDYLPTSQLLAGVKSGYYHQGIFNVSTYNLSEGSVPMNAFPKPVLVQGREHMNRAVQGDIVCVQVFPKDQWKAPADKLVLDELDKNDNPEAEDGEDITVDTDEKVTHSNLQQAQPTGKVVGIIKRNWRPYVGIIDSKRLDQNTVNTRAQQNVFFLPYDRRIPTIRIRTRQAASLKGHKVVVSIDAWSRNSKWPEGHFVRDIGMAESRDAETETLLLEFDVAYRPFAKSVTDCLPVEGDKWVVPPKPADDLMDHSGWRGRRDLRNLLVCSIDPPNCQDIDDALHARPLPNGNYEVGVHIADVSHFVKPETAMDAEAASRGTTVYLVDKRIDMLPPLLGTNLCSLMPNVERFAFSTLWEITTDAEIVKVEFTKSVIKSQQAFEYEQAQAKIDTKSDKEPVTESMRTLNMLAKKLRQKRMDAGALNLASPEVKIQTESETSDPIDVQTKALVDTNSLVEEFMLLANISVAARIYQAYPNTAMLRRHGAPPKTNFEGLQDMLQKRKGMTLRVESSKALADSLDEAVDPKDAFINKLIRIMATRCMLSAEYFCAGSFAPEEFRHYGLATEIYTHFTSPIRRYADVVAHRQLSAAIEYEALHPSLLSKSMLEKVCHNINFRHRMGQMAGRASVEFYVSQVLKNKKTEEDGYVIKVFENGYVVFVPRYGIEGVIHEEGEEFEPEEYTLTVKGKKVGVFDKLRVVVSVDKGETAQKGKVKLEAI